MAERGRVAVLTAVRPKLRPRSKQVLIVVAVLGRRVGVLDAGRCDGTGISTCSVYNGAMNYWVHNGGDIYDYLLPGSTVRLHLSDRSPPLVMLPMAIIGWHVAIVISVSMTCRRLGLIIYWLIGPIVTRQGWPFWFALAIAFGLVAAFEPLRETVHLRPGQHAAAVPGRGRPAAAGPRGGRLGGIGIGLATAIKLTPASSSSTCW